MKTRYLLTIILGLVLIALFSQGCENGNTETRNMEQIYAEEGVPVTTRVIEKQPFTVWREFNAVLTGIEESSAFAAVDDQVEKIYVTVGDMVKKDDVILAFPTDNPSARYGQARAAFENAEATFKRIENLYASGGISRQDLDNARTAYEVARADWQSVQQSIEVQAPISGTVTKINVRESDNVRHDDELFTISRTDRMKATVWVSDKQISDFKPGSPATATWNDHILHGSVVRVDMSMDQARQAFGVVVEFDNRQMQVKGGVTAKIRVENYTNPDAVIAERKDVIQDASGIFVFVSENGKASRRQVSLGHSSGIYTEVIAGLSVGDTLITEGQMHLENGTKIKVIAPAVTAATE